MDKSTTLELLNFILESIRLIHRRFEIINCGDDFLENDDGLDRLDAISMRIQSIGEALKNLYKREESLLLQVEDKNYWSTIIKARDFISHHYVDLDAETIFDICTNELNILEENIKQLKSLCKTKALVL
jgi:uncharacterized protein with HEPN domain